jgi:hypothetical protein
LAEESQQTLQQLCTHILLPLEEKFNEITATYGFTSFAVLNLNKSFFIFSTLKELPQRTPRRCAAQRKTSIFGLT